VTLAANWCEECGQAKSFRMWPGTLTGCATCDEVVTRHRCTGRPDIDALADGQAWVCPDCGSTWTPRTETEDCLDCCGACGHQVTVRRWDSEKGDRIDSAPRHEPEPFTPLRNAIYQTVRTLTDLPKVSPWRGITPPPAGPSGSCYRMGGGSMVHVKPGCRCLR